jgi:hypothetical protein
MRTQKELKPVLEKELRKVWGNDERMTSYCMKEAAYIIELSDGSILTIDKPRIKKDFCFGYGMYLQCTDEDFRRADGMREKAEKDVNYFMEKNLEEINGKIQALKQDRKNVYTSLHYIGQEPGDLLKSYLVTREWETPNNEFDNRVFWNLKEIKQLDNEDIELIITGLEEVKKSFIKRLNTYLKKYGLSKINAWTYLVD